MRWRGLGAACCLLAVAAMARAATPPGSGPATQPAPTPTDIKLMDASGRGSPQLCAKLIEEGGNVRARDPHGCTALYFAAGRADKNALEVVKLLVTHGADVRATRGGGSGPLEEACASGLTSVVQYLVAHGADVHARDSWGSTALHLAATRGEFPEGGREAVGIVKVLLSNGADVNARDKRGKTALDYAEEKDPGNKELLQLLRGGAADKVAN